MEELRVGCVGWDHVSWRPSFYAARSPRSRFLEQYASRFGTTEVALTAVERPSDAMLARWIQRVHDHEPFGFVLHAPLSVTDDALPRGRLPALLRRIDAFAADVLRPIEAAHRLEAVLVRTPTGFAPNRLSVAVLRAGLARLRSGGRRVAVEFAHPAWTDATGHLLPSAATMLRAEGVAVVRVDRDERGFPGTRTADWSYVRMAGRSGTDAGYAYRPSEIAQSAAGIRACAARDRRTLVVFDNGAHAPRNAFDLLRELEDHTTGPWTPREARLEDFLPLVAV